MKYKVMYTAGAKKDLRNIFRYISEELLAPENAAGQTERIMTAIRKLDITEMQQLHQIWLQKVKSNIEQIQIINQNDIMTKTKAIDCNYSVGRFGLFITYFHSGNYT